MNLLLMAMAVSIVVGMVFHKQEQVWRILMILLSIGVTMLYFLFPDRFM